MDSIKHLKGNNITIRQLLSSPFRSSNAESLLGICDSNDMTSSSSSTDSLLIVPILVNTSLYMNSQVKQEHITSSPIPIEHHCFVSSFDTKFGMVVSLTMTMTQKNLKKKRRRRLDEMCGCVTDTHSLSFDYIYCISHEIYHSHPMWCDLRLLFIHQHHQHQHQTS